MQRASALGLTGDAMKQYVLDETSSLRTRENVDAAWRALALVVANEPDNRWAERDSVKARNSCNSIFKLIMTPTAHPDWLTTSSEPSAATAPMRTGQSARVRC
jgi:hypothetical protein